MHVAVNMTTANLSGCNTQRLNVANKEQSLNVPPSEEARLILRAAGKLVKLNKEKRKYFVKN